MGPKQKHDLCFYARVQNAILAAARINSTVRLCNLGIGEHIPAFKEHEGSLPPIPRYLHATSGLSPSSYRHKRLIKPNCIVCCYVNQTVAFVKRQFISVYVLTPVCLNKLSPVFFLKRKNLSLWDHNMLCSCACETVLSPLPHLKFGNSWQVFTEFNVNVTPLNLTATSHFMISQNARTCEVASTLAPL